MNTDWSVLARQELQRRQMDLIQQLRNDELQAVASGAINLGELAGNI